MYNMYNKQNCLESWWF